MSNEEQPRVLSEDARRVLKALMRTRGLTQTEVARRARVHVSLVNKVIHGERNREDVRVRIARMLRLPYEHVWGEHAATDLLEALRVELTARHLAEVEQHVKRATNG